MITFCRVRTIRIMGTGKNRPYSSAVVSSGIDFTTDRKSNKIRRLVLSAFFHRGKHSTRHVVTESGHSELSICVMCGIWGRHHTELWYHCLLIICSIMVKDTNLAQT